MKESSGDAENVLSLDRSHPSLLCQEAFPAVPAHSPQTAASFVLTWPFIICVCFFTLRDLSS